MDDPRVRREQRCGGDHLDRPGDVYHPNFERGRPAFFDVSVRHTLRPDLISRAAEQPGVAALLGEKEKDDRHAEEVERAGGLFFPLVVETFGVWAPASLVVVKDVARRTTTHGGLSCSVAWSNLLQQLSVCLWSYNARLLRSRLSLEGSPLWDLPS